MALNDARLNPQTAAVLTVHLQNDIANPDGAFGPIFAEEAARNATLTRAAELLAGVRGAGGWVTYARIGFAADYSDMVDNIPLLQTGKQAGALVNGTWQTEIVPQVAPEEGDLVLTHTRTSPFQDSALDRLYRARGIDTVVVCGIATNASVEDGARAAANLGYRAIIASDATSAATLAAHEATLESFALFGEVATNAELFSRLSA